VRVLVAVSHMQGNVFSQEGRTSVESVLEIQQSAGHFEHSLGSHLWQSSAVMTSLATDRMQTLSRALCQVCRAICGTAPSTQPAGLQCGHHGRPSADDRRRPRDAVPGRSLLQMLPGSAIAYGERLVCDAGMRDTMAFDFMCVTYRVTIWATGCSRRSCWHCRSCSGRNAAKRC